MALLSIGEILDLGNSANMSSYIPYSALDYDPTGAISGISGSAIAGGVESSVVSSIVSSMVSGKADQSALEDCCSSMSSVVSSIQNDVSSISSYVSGLTGEYLEKSASSMFAPSADYAYNSSVSAKLDASASSEFYSTSNPSGFITAVDLDGYATTAYVDSSVSGKMDKSESSSFYPMTGNPSGFLTDVDMSDYATTAYVDSSVSGKMDATASGYLQPSGDYAYNSSLSSYLPASASGDFITSTAGLAPSGDYAYNSAVSGKLDASASSQFALSGDYAYNSSLTNYIPFSSVSGESNLITAINGSAISGQGGGGGGGIDSATCSAIASAYAESAVSSYVPYSALKNGPTTATISAIDNSAVYDYSAHTLISTLSTSRIPYSALESADGVITAISGTAIGGGGTGTALPSAAFDIDTANMSSTWVSTSTYKIGVKTDADWLSAKADSSAMSSKLDATASSMFQPSGNYQTAGSYATGASVVIVNDSSLATASDVVYVVVP